MSGTAYLIPINQYEVKKHHASICKFRREQRQTPKLLIEYYQKAHLPIKEDTNKVEYRKSSI